jgi:preprotein translocase subunit SecD
MTICGQHGKHHFCFHPVLVFAVLAVIFTTALTVAGLAGDQTEKHKFEVRLASHEKVEGWERVPGPGLEKAFVWISPEVALTNGDVEIARPGRTPGGKLCVLVFFTEDGALKQARLTKSHVGEFLAILLDGRVTMVPRINTEVTGREAMLEGKTEEEVVSIAVGLSGGKIKFEPWKHKFSTGKIKFECRLASYQKMEGWELGLFPEPGYGLVFISPEVALTNRDVARAYPEPDRTDPSKLEVGILLTEEGALKMARLNKSHIGKNLAVILDGRAVSVFPIVKEYTSGRALIPGNFTEEEANSIAKGIMMK